MVAPNRALIWFWGEIRKKTLIRKQNSVQKFEYRNLFSNFLKPISLIYSEKTPSGELLSGQEAQQAYKKIISSLK